MELARTFVVTALGLIALYLVFSHGDVAVNLVNSGEKFVTGETVALQGR